MRYPFWPWLVPLLASGLVLAPGCGEEMEPCEEAPLGDACAWNPGVDAPSARLVLDPDDPAGLLTESGTPYPLVAINRFNLYTPACNGDGLEAPAYLDLLSAAGITLVRVFVPGDTWLEPEIGAIDESALLAVDGVLDAAWERRLGVVLALFDHFPLRNGWPETAWSAFGADSTAFFRNPEAVAAARERTGRLVARWRDHPAVAAWEPINELNGVNPVYDDAPGALRAEAIGWAEEMVAAIRAADGRGRLVTLSLIADTSWPELWARPEADIIQLHTYPGRLGPEGVADRVRALVAEHQRFGKPVWIGEIAMQPGACRVPALRSAVEAAAELGSAAFVWTHVHDEFGDVVPGELERIYGRARCHLAD